MATKAAAWTETEKLGILFQIIEQGGSIPWDKIKLPEGRTQKAVTVMIDREKKKVRDARQANGEGRQEVTREGAGKARAGAKRKTVEDGAAIPKKPKTPRKMKEAAKAASDEEDGEQVDKVKAELEDADEFL